MYCSFKQCFMMSTILTSRYMARWQSTLVLRRVPLARVDLSFIIQGYNYKHKNIFYKGKKQNKCQCHTQYHIYSNPIRYIPSSQTQQRQRQHRISIHTEFWSPSKAYFHEKVELCESFEDFDIGILQFGQEKTLIAFSYISFNILIAPNYTRPV